jgi:hypothetical protein
MRVVFPDLRMSRMHQLHNLTRGAKDARQIGSYGVGDST